ncbi:hypothetical protein [Alienimonas sp. DA493]|uniref:hypothetical protein n=1 Tax=Alienimonas sp. DA493 TaxID=3373605 RepID=UPI003754A37E
MSEGNPTPPAVSSDWAIAGGALGFGSPPAALLVYHGLTRPPIHREFDLLRVESLVPLAVIAVLFGLSFGGAAAALVRQTRPGWGGRRPRSAAFVAGYAGGAVGFAVGAAGVALLSLIVEASRPT